MNSRDESDDGQTLALYKAQPSAVQTLIKHQFFALMLRYKLFSHFASVYVVNFDGINEFRAFNSVDGPQPAGVELLFQKTVGHDAETIAHPWYNGILEADSFMTDRFPEIWNLVLLEMVQDKHGLFNDYVQSVDTFNRSSPNPFANRSIWLDVLETIVGAHIRSVAGVLFERNEVTKQKKWKQDGSYYEFVENILDDHWTTNIRQNIFQQEQLYNNSEKNDLSFVELVKIHCKMIEGETENAFNENAYEDDLWLD
jgi:hypothetical protein